jgi:hypothetical protein
MSQFPHVRVNDSRGMQLCRQAADRIVRDIEICRVNSYIIQAGISYHPSPES